uniref:Uncharacterized protein n=1 Tax=Ralstonia solanacearum TaxID=305 RepID=A0A0S4WUC8_RALSL|nr:protein of unknown function [Ralstonia solanacearum]
MQRRTQPAFRLSDTLHIATLNGTCPRPQIAPEQRTTRHHHPLRLTFHHHDLRTCLMPTALQYRTRMRTDAGLFQTTSEDATIASTTRCICRTCTWPAPPKRSSCR